MMVCGSSTWIETRAVKSEKKQCLNIQFVRSSVLWLPLEIIRCLFWGALVCRRVDCVLAFVNLRKSIRKHRMGFDCCDIIGCCWQWDGDVCCMVTSHRLNLWRLKLNDYYESTTSATTWEWTEWWECETKSRVSLTWKRCCRHCEVTHMRAVGSSTYYYVKGCIVANKSYRLFNAWKPSVRGYSEWGRVPLPLPWMEMVRTTQRSYIRRHCVLLQILL